MGIIYEETQFNQDYLDFISLPEAKNGSIILDQMPKVIEMKQVSFRYPNSERTTIQDVSVKIRQGESVVLVGENGSGKSTLVKLLLGLYECESGEVLLDKVPMTQIQKESLYDRLSLMMQNSLNYKATLREAVTLADQKGADDEQRIWKALQQAKIDDIAGEEGLDTRLGNEFGGKELSGGQWQKLALARTLYKNSDFVVLDEPTSAIDPLTEMEILKTFLSNFKGRTSIIVSHRVGICTCADKIVVMKEGRLTECGTHEELMKKQGVYYEMFHTQAKWYN